MTLLTRETYVNLSTDTIFGDSGPRPVEAYADTLAELFRDMQEEFGRCTGKVYRDGEGGEPRQVGWTFLKRMVYEDARPDHYSRAGRPIYAENEHYLREVWVEVFDSWESETTVTAHHPFGSR